MPRSLKFKDVVKRSPIKGIEVPRRPPPPSKPTRPPLRTLPQFPVLFDKFRQGQQKVYLPNFALTLLRTPYLSPYYATFLVPLNFSKLDLRDYLFNLYNVKTLKIRSYVQQQKPQKFKYPLGIPNADPVIKWHRPRSIKKMTVELRDGFAWPAEPTDLEPWDNKMFKEREEIGEERRKYMRLPQSRMERPGAETYAQEARKLLLRETQWEDVGEPIEVDKHQA